MTQEQLLARAADVLKNAILKSKKSDTAFLDCFFEVLEGNITKAKSLCAFCRKVGEGERRSELQLFVTDLDHALKPDVRLDAAEDELLRVRAMSALYVLMWMSDKGNAAPWRAFMEEYEG